MFCPRCGKELPEGSYDILCEDCKKEQAEWQKYNAKNNPPQQPSTRMIGFGKALAATVMSAVAYILILIAVLFLLTGATVGLGNVTASSDMPLSSGSITAALVFGIIFSAVSIGLSVTSIIFGKKSIETFIEIKRQGKAKPIATLALGIAGIVLAAITLFIALITLIVVIILAI